MTDLRYSPFPGTLRINNIFLFFQIRVDLLYGVKCDR